MPRSTDLYGRSCAACGTPVAVRKHAVPLCEDHADATVDLRDQR